MRVRLPCCGPSFRGRASRGCAKGPFWRRGVAGRGSRKGIEGRGSTKTCRPARLVVSYPSHDVSSPIRVPGVGQCLSVHPPRMFGPVRGQTAREFPQDRLVGVIPSSHQPWGAEIRPAGRTALARRMCPSRGHHQRGFFPRPHSRTEIACRMSALPAHESQQPAQSRPTEPRSRGFEVVVVQTKTSRFLAGTVLRPPAVFRFRRDMSASRSIAASKPCGRENKAGDAEY